MKLRAFLLACVIATPAEAAVTKLSIEKTSPLPGGYELLEGHFSGALEPGDPHNAIINDIGMAVSLLKTLTIAELKVPVAI